MGFWRSMLHVFLVMVAAAALMALYLLTKHLVGGPFQPTETPVIWLWDNFVVYCDQNRWWDSALAAAWTVIPTLMIIDRIHYYGLHWSPLLGLVASGGIHLVFWGEPGVVFWPMMVLPALIIARVIHLIDERYALENGIRPNQRFNFIYASEFIYSFGLGMLLPLAIMHGFWLATLVWWIYSTLALVMCAVIFFILNAHRPFVWLFRKIAALVRARGVS